MLPPPDIHHHHSCPAARRPGYTEPLDDIPRLVDPINVLDSIPETPKPLPRISAGSTLEVAGEGLGTQAGQVLLHVSGLTLPTTIERWTDEGVVLTLPALGLTSQLQAELNIVLRDGESHSSVAIELAAAE